MVVRTSRTIHRNQLLFTQPMHPSKTKLTPTPFLPLLISSHCHRFAAIVTPSSCHLPLPLPFPLPPSPVSTSAITDISSISLLLLLPSIRLAAASKPIQVCTSVVTSAVTVVLLLPPSYHKLSLRRLRCCYLDAAVSTESSSHRFRRYRCRLVADISVLRRRFRCHLVAAVATKSSLHRCYRCRLVTAVLACAAAISVISSLPSPLSPFRTITVATSAVLLLLLLPYSRRLCHLVAAVVTKSSAQRRRRY